MRSPGYWWWALRRDWRRGIGATVGDRIFAPRIWRWRNPHAAAPTEAMPVAVVLGRDHLTMAAWMLASWSHATGRNWRIALHDDGSLPEDTGQRFRALGFDLTVVKRSEADALVIPALEPFPQCRAYRKRVPLALKIFDVPLLQVEPRILLLDPDVLFFARPAEILGWVDRADDDSCWFNADVAEASAVSAEEARDRLAVSLWPRVNSGLCLLTRAAIDPAFCERVMGETSILKGHFWRVEQTLFALCASRWARGGLLPGTYEVSLGRHAAPGCIARHYVGAVRDRFYAEGIARLRKELRP